MRRFLRPLIGLLITIVLITLLVRTVDVTRVATTISRIDQGALLLALGSLAMGYLFRILRWWLMLRAVDTRITPSACVWPFLVSIALNNLLPLRAGDAVRVVGFRAQLQAPGMRLLGTLLVERLLDVLVLLTVFFIGVSGVPSGGIPQTFVAIAAGAAGVAVVVLAATLALSSRLERLLDWLARRPLLARRGLGDPLRKHGQHFIEALTTLQSPRVTLLLIACSALAWAFEGGVFVAVARGLHMDVSAAGPWFALATGTLATVLPSSPGYVGTFDYFVVLGLMAYGAPREAAAAFAVVVHLVIWLPLTLAGLLYFVRPGTRVLLADSLATQSSSRVSN